MIVILELPQRTAGFAFEIDRRVLLERLYEFYEIAGLRRSGCQKMHVIRHHAIRMHEKFARRRMFLEPSDNPARDPRIRAESATLLKAEGDEIKPPPAIVFGRQPNVFALEWHACGHGRTQEYAGLKSPALHLNLKQHAVAHQKI